MSWVAVAVGVGGAVLGSMASRSAASTQADASMRAAETSAAAQERMFDKQTQLQEPFRQAGLTGQNRLMELLGLGGNAGAQGYGKYAQDFGMSDFEQDPGYAFRLSEGQKALDRSAAARGGLQSGSALKAAARYGQDMGSQEYQNAFNRYQLNRANQLQPLQSLAGQAQTSANTLTGAAGQLGQGLANTYESGITGAGNARASGYMGQANAISGGLGQYLNYQQGQNYLNALTKRPTTYGYSTSYGE